MNKQYSGLSAILPLFLVIFIDGMGMGIIFPILNPIYMSVQQGILPAHSSMELRNFLYGLTLMMFPLFMFFGTPILGDLSDSAGRKKVLLICLLGAAIGYGVSAVGVEFKSVVLLLVGRIIAGFTAGSQPVAQAAVIDVSPPEKKAKNLSLLMLPASLGFVAGPLISGYLSDPKLVGWFSLTTPLFFAALVSLLNACYLVFSFSDIKPTSGQVKIKLSRGVSLFISAFTNKKIRYLSIAFLFMSLGWGCYFQFIPLFLNQVYHYSPQLIGIFMAILGLGFALGFVVFVPIIAAYFKPMYAVFLMYTVSAIAVFVTVLPPMVWPAWVATLPLALCMATGYSLMLTIFSNQVSEEHQGWIMGVAMSVLAFGFTIMSIIPGFLQDLGHSVTLIVSAILFTLSAITMYYIRHHKV